MANKYAVSALKLSDTYVNTLPYNTCSTAAGTAAKVVSAGDFALETGAMVVVKFTVTNTASNPTLNVSDTGAKAIYYNGKAITKGYLKANKVYQFIYNGTQWDLVGDVDTNSTYTVNNSQITISAGKGLTTGGSFTLNQAGAATITLDVGAGTGISVDDDTVSLATVNTDFGTGKNIGSSGAVTPAYGATFDVPHFTVDSYGRVTAAATHTVKIPVSDNTTYTFAEGTTNGAFSVTPSGGSAQSVPIHGLAAAAYKGIVDSSSASAISTGTNVPTERDIYYGLPTINNSHAYTSSTNIYAPTAGGTAGNVLIGNGATAAPVWTNRLTVSSTGVNVTGALSLDNAAKFVYNSDDKCIDLIFM